MKKHTKLFINILSVVAAALSSAAMASDGTLTITGTVSTKTCTINGVAEGVSVVNIPIALGTVSTASFNGVGKVGGTVLPAAGVNLTACGATTQVQFTLDGTGSIDTATKTYKNTTLVGSGGAANMAAQVVNSTTNVGIDPNGSDGILTTITAGVGTIPVGVRFYSLGVAGAGTFTAVAGFNLQYP